ncbi:hypothetical protein BASA81_001542 [Batrachochytrium salamandrivorans]|nr:hypothetical protein BASA81_001542 [Batrachochytrium salamandrivorans]
MTLLEENKVEFGMDDAEATKDAFQQLKSRKFIEFVAQTPTERASVLKACEGSRKQILIFELLIQGGIGGAMHCAVTSQSTLACELICFLCDNCDLAKSCVPSIAIKVFIEFAMGLVSKNEQAEPYLLALLSIMRNHEDNKQVMYENNFNHLLHVLLLSSNSTNLACSLVKEYCLETSLTEISNNSFTRCRKLGEETCLVDKLAAMLPEPVALDALRLVCVNDAVCSAAIRAGALDRALSQLVLDRSVLLFVRQVCLNDEAKRKIAEQGVLPLYLQVLRSTRTTKETCKLALMGLRNAVSHPNNLDVRQLAVQLGAEQACRETPHAAKLKVYVEDLLRDLGLTNFKS